MKYVFAIGAAALAVPAAVHLRRVPQPGEPGLARPRSTRAGGVCWRGGRLLRVRRWAAGRIAHPPAAPRRPERHAPVVSGSGPAAGDVRVRDGGRHLLAQHDEDASWCGTALQGGNDGAFSQARSRAPPPSDQGPSRSPLCSDECEARVGGGAVVGRGVPNTCGSRTGSLRRPRNPCARSGYIPEELRATIINIFRIPLNLFVCVVVANVGGEMRLCIAAVAVHRRCPLRLEPRRRRHNAAVCTPGICRWKCSPWRLCLGCALYSCCCRRHVRYGRGACPLPTPHQPAGRCHGMRGEGRVEGNHVMHAPEHDLCVPADPIGADIEGVVSNLPQGVGPRERWRRGAAGR